MIIQTKRKIDDKLENRLYNAIISYFKNENYKLGLGLPDHRIDEICKILLYENVELSDSFPSWKIGEECLLDEYRKEELEIIDYLHLISNELRKQLGQYATPASIVRYILKSVSYDPDNNILASRLIDPACGSGAFLVESVRIYLSALKKAGIPIYKWYNMTASSITGIDIDPTACFFSRVNLSMLLAPAVLEFAAKNSLNKLEPLPVYCADTLQLLAYEKEVSTMLYSRLNMPLNNQFDFVVGNPPYFKIKGLKEDLKTAFTESIYGHPNAYALFIHAGIDMLKKDGKLGYIVPRSMLSGLYFKNLRDFIETKTSINEILYLADRKNVFDKVLHGTMILSLEKGRKETETINISFAQSSKDMGNDCSAITTSRENVIQRLNGSTVWFIADSPKIYRIIDRIIKRHPLLSGHEIDCCAKTGQIVWNRVKPLLISNSNKNTLPLVWSTDVGKFTFSFNRLGILRPCFLKVNAKTDGLVVKGQSILVQRITADEQPSRIVACIPVEFCKNASEGYFVENHLNIIQPRTEGASIDLYFILGVLNSSIVDFFFRAMNGNTQVSATELNLLPIPVGRYEKDISVASRIIQKKKSNKEKNKGITELNSLVAKAYGLSIKELEYIEKYLGSRFQRVTKQRKI